MKSLKAIHRLVFAETLEDLSPDQMIVAEALLNKYSIAGRTKSNGSAYISSIHYIYRSIESETLIYSTLSVPLFPQFVTSLHAW